MFNWNVIFELSNSLQRGRETQTLDFVLEILKFNVIMTISHAKVNPTALSYTHENRVKLQSFTYNWLKIKNPQAQTAALKET